MTLDRLGLIALGFIAGFAVASVGMSYSALHYDDQLRVFDALRRKYGKNLEQKPTP